MVVKHLRRATLTDGTTARESRRTGGASVPVGRDPADPVMTLRTPLYTLEDDQESLFLIIELPGASPNKIDLEVTDHDLVITATSDAIGAQSLFYRYHGTLTLPEEISRMIPRPSTTTGCCGLSFRRSEHRHRSGGKWRSRKHDLQKSKNRARCCRFECAKMRFGSHKLLVK